MNKTYHAEIVGSAKELSKIDQAKFITGVDAMALDEVVTPENKLKIKVANYVAISVHNEKSENTDYDVHYIISKTGEIYYTSSNSCIEKLADIMYIIEDEDVDIMFYKSPSKNYKGKYFLNCSIA